ncbi:hypothetical protein [Pseudomonas sp. HAR-UPW-AIA-41]|uniref:hypothetical protein n=1 Tax=Pseudomonas sp. HAR-UPW-AIA-41 TaxID=1985301 RepID=UPI001596DCB1|nr:hypothetical protein [Pseudomonas sp. HAR-UPW-AIA-41]
MRLVLTLILITLSLISNAAPIKGAGAGSCGEWVEERRENTYHATLHWIQGFLSAYNAYVYSGTNPDGVFGGADYKAIAVWMDNYCQKNPLSTPYTGAELLIKELEAQYN